MTRNAWIAAIVALLIGIGIGAGGSSSDNSSTKTTTVTKTVASPAFTVTEEADATPEPEPESPVEVDIDTACDYLLGDGTSDYRFVGSITANNVGDRDARVKAVASWKQLGGSPVEQTKTFTVKAGQEREVQFNVPATSDMISAHQSTDGSCKVRRQVTGL